nr:MAG TPA: DNA methyl phosphotriester repair domain protein [Caudoviricetes sp.]
MPLQAGGVQDLVHVLLRAADVLYHIFEVSFHKKSSSLSCARQEDVVKSSCGPVGWFNRLPPPRQVLSAPGGASFFACRGCVLGFGMVKFSRISNKERGISMKKIIVWFLLAISVSAYAGYYVGSGHGYDSGYEAGYDYMESYMAEKVSAEKVGAYDEGYQAGYERGLEEAASKSNSSEITSNPQFVPITPDNGNQSQMVYITNTGEKYHRNGCQYLRQSKIAISLDDAINQGYTACSRCW